jgi:hypothetical protein
MRTERNHSWLLWAVVALAVLNLSTLGTIFYQRFNYNKKLKEQALQSSSVIPAGMGFGRNYFIEPLGLSPEQLNEFHKFDPEFSENVIAVNYRLSELRNEMISEMTKPEYNAERLNELSDLIGAEHSTLKKLTYKYYLDIRSICKSQQQKTLDTVFAATLMNDRNPGYRGRGQRMRNRGRHQGWNQ